MKRAKDWARPGSSVAAGESVGNRSVEQSALGRRQEVVPQSE